MDDEQAVRGRGRRRALRRSCGSVSRSRTTKAARRSRRRLPSCAPCSRGPRLRDQGDPEPYVAGDGERADERVAPERRTVSMSTVDRTIPPSAFPPDEAELVERDRVLARAREPSAASARACLVLRFYEDRSERDVAAVLGCLGRHREEPDEQGPRQAPSRRAARARCTDRAMIDDIDAARARRDHDERRPHGGPAADLERARDGRSGSAPAPRCRRARRRVRRRRDVGCSSVSRSAARVDDRASPCRGRDDDDRQRPRAPGSASALVERWNRALRYCDRGRDPDRGIRFTIDLRRAVGAEARSVARRARAREHDRGTSAPEKAPRYVTTRRTGSSVRAPVTAGSRFGYRSRDAWFAATSQPKGRFRPTAGRALRSSRRTYPSTVLPAGRHPERRTFQQRVLRGRRAVWSVPVPLPGARDRRQNATIQQRDRDREARVVARSRSRRGLGTSPNEDSIAGSGPSRSRERSAAGAACEPTSLHHVRQ